MRENIQYMGIGLRLASKSGPTTSSITARIRWSKWKMKGSITYRIRCAKTTRFRRISCNAATVSLRNEKVPEQEVEFLSPSDGLHSWHAGQASRNESLHVGSKLVRNVGTQLWRIEKPTRCAIMKVQQLFKTHRGRVSMGLGWILQSLVPSSNT